MMDWPIVEIFESRQGEGFNTGRLATFIRLGRCNLNCPWCDTNYTQFTRMDAPTILAAIADLANRFFVITGGEPTIQPHLSEFVAILKQHYPKALVAIETNGLLEPPANIDYIATSPKRLYAKQYERRHLSHADEVRIVVDEPAAMAEFCVQIQQLIPATRYYLSPCETNGEFNLAETIAVLGALNEAGGQWLLSLQTHKLIGIH